MAAEKNDEAQASKEEAEALEVASKQAKVRGFDSTGLTVSVRVARGVSNQKFRATLWPTNSVKFDRLRSGPRILIGKFLGTK